MFYINIDFTYFAIYFGICIDMYLNWVTDPHLLHGFHVILQNREVQFKYSFSIDTAHVQY